MTLSYVVGTSVAIILGGTDVTQPVSGSGNLRSKRPADVDHAAPAKRNAAERMAGSR